MTKDVIQLTDSLEIGLSSLNFRLEANCKTMSGVYFVVRCLFVSPLDSPSLGAERALRFDRRGSLSARS